MPDRPPVSQREIAAQAGVSVMTVSRALRNDGNISKTEAQRIRALAEQMGYTSNPFLSTWMRNRRNRQRPHEREIVALVSFHSRFSAAPWFVEVRNGAEKFSQRCGYRVDTFMVGNYPNVATLFRILRNRGIRGVIMAPMLDAVFPKEAWQHSVVAIGQPWDVRKIDVVDADHYDGMVLVLSQLAKYGFKRIAYWSSILNVATHKRWEAAYRIYQLDLPSRDRLPVRDLDARGLTPVEHDDWVKKHRPEVIVCSNNQIYFDLQAASSPVIRQVSWVSLNREGISTFAGIDAHLDMVGEAAARLVTRMMELNEIGPPAFARTVFIQSEWFDGETLRITNGSFYRPPSSIAHRSR